MSSVELKVQILQSLGNLDKLQSEKVLEFIRVILRSRNQEEDYLNFKRRAMDEIKTALSQLQGPRAA